MTSRDLVLIGIGLIIGALIAGVAVNGSLQPAVSAAETQVAAVQTTAAQAASEAATAAAGQELAEQQAATAAAGQELAQAQADTAAQQISTLSAQLTQLAPTLEGQRTVNQAAAVSDFYLAALDEAPAWLADGLKVELPESLADLSALAGDIQDPESLLVAAADAENPLRLLLRTAYEGVAGALPSGADLPVAACLALENDFFTGGAVLYFYIQLPKPDVADTKPLAIPQGWRLLDGPLPQSEVWTSVCYEAADAEADAVATPSS